MFDDGAEAAKQRIELAGQVIEVFREAGVAGDAFTVTAVLGFLAARAFASKDEAGAFEGWIEAVREWRAAAMASRAV